MPSWMGIFAVGEIKMFIITPYRSTEGFGLLRPMILQRNVSVSESASPSVTYYENAKRHHVVYNLFLRYVTCCCMTILRKNDKYQSTVPVPEAFWRCHKVASRCKPAPQSVVEWYPAVVVHWRMFLQAGLLRSDLHSFTIHTTCTVKWRHRFFYYV